MPCFEAPTETTYAAVMSNVAAMKHALHILNTIGLVAYFNPYTGCAPNMSSHDFIIAGGGTSGCVLASRLSEDPNINVLLIEAGTNFPVESSMGIMMLYTQRGEYTWNYTLANGRIDGEQENNFITTAGKVLGGTSSVNFMIHSQGFDSDYDKWAEITNEPSWCFSNIQRLIKKVERFNDQEIYNSCDKEYHGFEGNVGLYKDRSPILDKYFETHKQAGNKILPDINNGNKLGYSGTVFFVDNNIRQNSAYAYLLPAKHRPNLIVMKDMQVTKILIDENKRAVGVEAVATKTNKQYTFRAKKEVILAAGAFNTPKLLQLSGIGPCKLLNKHGIDLISDVPAGYNYMNHVITPLPFAMQKIDTPYISEDYDPYKFPSHSYDGYANPNKSECHPVYRAFSYIASFNPPTMMLQYTSAYFNYDKDVVEYWYEQATGREVVFTQIQDLYPKSRGLVEIQSQNPFDPPLIQAEHYAEEIDLKNAVVYVKHFLKTFLDTDYMKQCGGFFIDAMRDRCGVYDYDCDEYWVCYVRHLMVPMADQCGTAAMGSVVDGRLRVYGVKGLRVADASVMPTIVSGSATIPVMVITENAAEMIIQDWSCECE